MRIESPAATMALRTESTFVPVAQTFSTPERARSGVRMNTDEMSGRLTIGRMR